MSAPVTSMPTDGNSKPFPLTPAHAALATTYSTSISGSTTVTLNANTTLIEVNALSQGIFLKWGGTASSSTFDEYIQAGMTRHYVVPTSSTGALYTTVQFIQQAASATLVVIEK